MSNRKVQDPQTARFLRKKNKTDDHDQEQQNQQAAFYQDPSKAINRYAKKKTQKNIQKQVEYFGNAIQPFHMRQEAQLGQIDQDGFFVFSKKNRVRDAWLDSIGEGQDEQIVDKLVKRIKQESRFQSVYEAGQKINNNLQQNQQQSQNEQEYDGAGIQEAPESQQKQSQENGLSKQQLIEIILSIIPQQVKTNANNYMKKLKKQNKLQQYNKLLTVCNEYIQKTNQYDILTKKRQQLQDILDQINEERIKKNVYGVDQQIQQKFNKLEEDKIDNWDVDDEEDDQQQERLLKQRQQARKKLSQSHKNQVQENQSDSENQQNQQDNDNDNIF